MSTAAKPCRFVTSPGRQKRSRKAQNVHRNYSFQTQCKVLVAVGKSDKMNKMIKMNKMNKTCSVLTMLGWTDCQKIQRSMGQGKGALRFSPGLQK
jgi:hypothetical protein